MLILFFFFSFSLSSTLPTFASFASFSFLLQNEDDVDVDCGLLLVGVIGCGLEGVGVGVSNVLASLTFLAKGAWGADIELAGVDVVVTVFWEDLDFNLAMLDKLGVLNLFLSWGSTTDTAGGLIGLLVSDDIVEGWLELIELLFELTLITFSWISSFSAG